MARRPVALAPEAEGEVREAFLWYAERNPQTGARFEEEMIEALDRIADAPEQGPDIEAGVRRLLLHRFPYGVLYIVEPERVLVLAVMHLHRRPGYWRGRGP